MELFFPIDTMVNPRTDYREDCSPMQERRLRLWEQDAQLLGYLIILYLDFTLKKVQSLKYILEWQNLTRIASCWERREGQVENAPKSSLLHSIKLHYMH